MVSKEAAADSTCDQHGACPQSSWSRNCPALQDCREKHQLRQPLPYSDLACSLTVQMLPTEAFGKSSEPLTSISKVNPGLHASLTAEAT